MMAKIVKVEDEVAALKLPKPFEGGVDHVPQATMVEYVAERGPRQTRLDLHLHPRASTSINFAFRGSKEGE
jgi:hypothetical protein